MWSFVNSTIPKVPHRLMYSMYWSWLCKIKRSENIQIIFIFLQKIFLLCATSWFQIEYSVLEAMATSCCNLEQLYMSGIRSVSDQILLSVGTNCPKVKGFGVKSCSTLVSLLTFLRDYDFETFIYLCFFLSMRVDVVPSRKGLLRSWVKTLCPAFCTLGKYLKFRFHLRFSKHCGIGCLKTRLLPDWKPSQDEPMHSFFKMCKVFEKKIKLINSWFLLQVKSRFIMLRY